ncbi:MAG: acetate/propionate family kinase [Acidobacteriaceae bacterium]|nr:acetate/propionate family kinase [Acidobacteriaceae bacterium]
MTESVKSTILVLNSGSSSLKLGVFQPGGGGEELLLSGSAEGIGQDSGSLRIQAVDGSVLAEQSPILESQSEALQALASALQSHLHTQPVSIVHRIVHGGPHLREHQELTPHVLQELEAAEHFAPLHIPLALKLVRQAKQIFPDAVHYACFDTAFHRTLPKVAARFALPEELFEQGVLRYGFHGLSYESVLYRLKDKLPTKAVFAHLGNGSSVTAVLEGRSIDTSMGLTPTGGVPMSTRSGDLDPGVLLYLMRSSEQSADGLEDLLNRQSGLSALSGGDGDMQKLVKAANDGDTTAELAVEAYCIAVRKYIGAYAALLGGLDLLVFTGGIGEHSAEVRQRICTGLTFLGISSAEDSSIVRVMHAEEELQMARHCRTLMEGKPLAL